MMSLKKAAIVVLMLPVTFPFAVVSIFWEWFHFKVSNRFLNWLHGRERALQAFWDRAELRAKKGGG